MSDLQITELTPQPTVQKQELPMQKKTNEPTRILVYGPPKMGKSTFGSMAYKPVFIQIEDGLDAIDVNAMEKCETIADVFSRIKSLAECEHDYRTVVVDSVDWLERLIHVQVCKEANVKTMADIPYGRGHVMALSYFEKYINALEYLRKKRGMMIIQIAHSEIKKFENPETDSYDRHQIKLHSKAAAVLTEHSDIILFVNRKTYIKKENEGFSERARVVGAGERMLYTTGTGAFEAGNRYSLPPEIPFDKEGAYWGVIASYVPFLRNLGKDKQNAAV